MACFLSGDSNIPTKKELRRSGRLQVLAVRRTPAGLASDSLEVQFHSTCDVVQKDVELKDLMQVS